MPEMVMGYETMGFQMMQIAKKFFVTSLFFFITVLLCGEARAEKRIGVLIFSEEVRYDETTNGILDQLKKDGFGEPKVKYTIGNAKGSKARMVELVNEFSKAKMDLIAAIGTGAVITAAKEIQDVPIVFRIFDPVESGVSASWKSSGNNTTGVSTKVSIPNIVSSLMELMPIKRLAVLYTPGEKNSEMHLAELQKIQANFKIKVVPIILTKKEDVPQIISEVVKTVDAIYLTGSSIAGATAQIIVDIANKEKVPTITHLDDLMEKGVLLGGCANSYQVGRLIGKKAVQIMKGAKPSSIPIETVKKVDLVLNMKTVKAGQFQIPPAFMKKVTKTVE